jgi:hypothetical protein
MQVGGAARARAGSRRQADHPRDQTRVRLLGQGRRASRDACASTTFGRAAQCVFTRFDVASRRHIENHGPRRSTDVDVEADVDVDDALRDDGCTRSIVASTAATPPTVCRNRLSHPAARLPRRRAQRGGRNIEIASVGRSGRRRSSATLPTADGYRRRDLTVRPSRRAATINAGRQEPRRKSVFDGAVWALDATVTRGAR